MKRGVGDDPFADESDTAPTTDASDESEPTTAPVADDDELADSILAALDAIETGEENKNISLRDREAKALLLSLEDRQNQRQELASTLDLGEDATQSDIVRGLIRAGLKTTAPAVHEELATAIGEYARDAV